MPKQYEAIRDKFISEGLSEKEAKTRAAKIYNAKHKENPVGRVVDRKKGGMVPKTGNIHAHKGELVIPKKDVEEVKDKMTKGKKKKDAPFYMS